MSDEGWSEAVHAHDDGATIDVHAQPRASRTEVKGLHGGRVKIALAAPPVDGAANKALVKGLASLLGVARRDVTLVSGESGRRKRVLVAGMGPGAVIAALRRAAS